MKKAAEEELFFIDGQKSALHCLVMEFDESGVCINAHYHKYCEILYGIECDVDMLIGDRKEKLRDGDICFIYPGEPHYMYSQREKNRYYVIKFFPEILFYDGQSKAELCHLINLMGESCTSHEHILVNNEKDYYVESTIKDIFDEWNEKNTGYEFAIRGKILILYSVILRLMKKMNINVLGEGKIALIHDAIIYTTKI